MRQEGPEGQEGQEGQDTVSGLEGPAAVLNTLVFKYN